MPRPFRREAPLLRLVEWALSFRIGAEGTARAPPLPGGHRSQCAGAIPPLWICAGTTLHLQWALESPPRNGRVAHCARSRRDRHLLVAKGGHFGGARHAFPWRPERG